MRLIRIILLLCMLDTILCAKHQLVLEHAATVEYMLEILYTRYLLNRAISIIQAVSTDYKFVVYPKTHAKDLVIPTYYEVGFRIENHANDTYTLHSVYTPRRLPKEEVQQIFDLIKKNAVPLRIEAKNTFSYIAEHLLRIIVSFSPSITYDVENDLHRFQMRENDKRQQQPWFTISPCTMCVQVSDALHPQFVCKTRLSGERLQQMHGIIPKDKTISQFDLRSAYVPSGT